MQTFADDNHFLKEEIDKNQVRNISCSFINITRAFEQDMVESKLLSNPK